ncbi:MAG: haloalkane dehalogenase [Nannocystaceae bacterium]|nr:haloalkane dehalogenase [Nannocystaceae bacterium]
MNPLFSLSPHCGVSLALALSIGCGHSNDTPSQMPETSTGSTTADQTLDGSGGVATASAEPSSGEGSTSIATSEGDADPDLALWPAPYQAFIAEVGGSKFLDVGGASMHYIDTGETTGETYLLVHGIPTHTYLWRDVIPHLTDKRVIAVDLIGFGRSDRPDIAYSPAFQAEYLSTFAETLNLTDVHLVVHDLGGPVGMYWASQAPQRIRSITMFETLWSTFPGGVESMPKDFAQFLTALRTPGVGEGLAGEQDVFVNGIPGLTVSGVSRQDMDVYRYPWMSAADREAVFLTSGPRAFPFPEDAEAFAFFAEYQEFLMQTEIPKLVFDVSPGALSAIQMTGKSGSLGYAQFAHQNFPNAELIELDNSGHYVQEDRAEALGQAIHSFVGDLQ